jgi:inositol phosphorylceramide mannosyltransferase catalytic subunit
MSWGVIGHAELAGIPDGEYLQWALVTVAGHPFLREVIGRVLRNIDDYAEWRSGIGRKGTLRLSGPVAYSLAIEPVRHLYPHTRLLSPTDRGFAYTALPHMESHRDAFGGSAHYTALGTPVVEPTFGSAPQCRAA